MNRRSIQKDSIINVLRELTPFVGPHPDLAFLNPQCAEYQRIDNYQVGAASEVIERLTAILRNDPFLQTSEDTTLQSSPGSAGFYTDTLRRMAQWLLAQSRKRAPEEVLDQLETFVRTNSVQVHHVVGLWGIHPSHPIDIYPGIKFMPLSLLPTSYWKDELTNVNVYRRDLPYSPMFTLRPKVDAALLQELIQKPIFTSSRIRTEAEQETVQAILRLIGAQYETMLKVARCLMLMDDSLVSAIMHWYHPEDTPLFGGAQSGGRTGLEHIYQFGVPAKDFDEDSVKSLVNSYFRLDKATRDQLRVPLARLNSSMMQKQNIEDAAIDLGIALEALLTKERDHDAPVSYLLRLRGTLLLGGDPETRRHNFYRIRELYILRSKAAHGENIAESMKVSLGPNRAKRSVSAREFLREGTKVCADMIRAVIQRGGIPDWEAMVGGW